MGVQVFLEKLPWTNLEQAFHTVLPNPIYQNYKLGCFEIGKTFNYAYGEGVGVGCCGVAEAFSFRDV